MEMMDYEAGEFLFAEGDPCRYCYKVLSGEVAILKWSSDAMRHETVVHAGPGAVFCAFELIEATATPYEYSIAAVEPTTCERYEGEDVVEFLKKNPDWVREAIPAILNKIELYRSMIAARSPTGETETPAVEVNRPAEEIVDLLRDEPDEALAFIRTLLRRLGDTWRELGEITLIQKEN